MHSIYQKLIRETLPGATDEQYREVEDIMRHDIFHSTLDWQTREQLREAALEAWHLLTVVYPLQDIQHDDTGTK